MPKKKPKAVREQVMVYLSAGDRALLEQLVDDTGLARTELLRRGLYQLANQTLTASRPGASMERLIETASQQEIPPDLSAQPDDYLYGGGYERWFAKQAAPRAKKRTPASKKPRARLR